MAWKIPLFKIYWDENDLRLVDNSIEKGMHWAVGPNIEKFESKISEYIGTRYAVTVNSGTSALHATLLAQNIGKGDEVIVPSFTFIATANAPIFVGAKPVFADIESTTFGLDLEDVKERITNKTKAIIPVHYGGGPCQIRELREIAEDHNLILVEDAAGAFGAKIKNKRVGIYGDCSIFSFCSPKIITTGEGGAIVTDSREIYEKLKLIRSHGRLETENYFSSTQYMDYITMGYNFRMSNIAAALGLSQINKVDKIIDMRRKVAEYLTKKLLKIEDVTTPCPPEDYFHIYQVYTIRVNEKKREGLKKYLECGGVMTKVYYDPVHKTHFYKNVLKNQPKLQVTEKISKEVLSLPVYPTLSKKEMDYIAEKIENFFVRDNIK